MCVCVPVCVCLPAPAFLTPAGPGSSSTQWLPRLPLTLTPSYQVQGAEEVQKERQRQKKLESNYRRVWGSRDGEGTGDLDEFDF